jgi:hypothetical protein
MYMIIWRAVTFSRLGVSMLSESERKRICECVRKGARMLVGRDHTGRQKIKLVKGPFGLFVERIECTETDLIYIRKALSKSTPIAA